MTSDIPRKESLPLVTNANNSDTNRDYGSKIENLDVDKNSENTTENTAGEKDGNTGSKINTRNKYILLGVMNTMNLLEWMSFFALVPFYPNEAIKRGLSHGTIGWIIAVFPISQLFSSYFAGVYMTRVGVKLMFCGGAFINSISVVAFGISHRHAIYVYVDRRSNRVCFADVKKSPYPPLEFFKLMTCCPVVLTTMVVVAHGLFFGFVEPTVAVYLKRYYHLSPTMIGLIYLVSILIYIIVSIPVGLLIDKVDLGKPFMVIGLCLTGLSTMQIGETPLFGITPGHQIWLPILGFSLVGASLIFGTVPVPGIIKAEKLKYADDINLNGLIASLFLIADSAGYIIGPLLGGYMTDAIGFPWSCTIVGLSLICFGLLSTIIITTCGGWKIPNNKETVDAPVPSDQKAQNNDAVASSDLQTT
ncbi:MFS-type transporter SLC18B1-like [Tubulanus polymorphus]|uniref:MFS-type transporter SLC18B1-like n=1 Tax=Tubulanus polymorphus TaxID=672921 RepID=UPI003DA37A92